jgi:hypothetical protein
MTTQLPTLRDPLFTREGLADYLGSSIKRPKLLSLSSYAALSRTERAAYNERRTDYISGGMTVETPDVQFARKFVAKAKLMNSRKPLGTNGLIVSGPPTAGKTTIIMSIMKEVWGKARTKHSGIAAHHVPIVFVEVPSGSTGRLLMVELAQFFGLSATRADTKDMIERRVVDAIYATRTELIVIDELHNLEASNRGNGESIDALKVLQDKTRADFIFAGVKLNETPLLSGARGTQISGRFAQLELELYNLDEPDKAATWGGIINAFEAALPLHGHPAGSLNALVPYLHDRTNGNLSSLHMLLAGAAIDLVDLPGAQREVITKQLLDAQHLDIAAEAHYRKVRTRAQTRKTQNRKLPK